jgi:hypothetical protein
MMIQVRDSAEDPRPRLDRLAGAELGSWRKSLAAELNFLRSSARHRLFKTLPTGLSHPQHYLNLLEKMAFTPRGGAPRGRGVQVLSWFSTTHIDT